MKSIRNSKLWKVLFSHVQRARANKVAKMLAENDLYDDYFWECLKAYCPMQANTTETVAVYIGKKYAVVKTHTETTEELVSLNFGGAHHE